eukprot:COSAG06_NODE_4106_length_4570_cov_52.303288_6_plen_45_part_00
MGVPLFFGWLRRKYPAIVATIVDLCVQIVPFSIALRGRVCLGGC